MLLKWLHTWTVHNVYKFLTKVVVLSRLDVDKEPLGKFTCAQSDAFVFFVSVDVPATNVTFARFEMDRQPN